MASTCLWIKAQILFLLVTPLSVATAAGLVASLQRCWEKRRQTSVRTSVRTQPGLP
jgi:hypothetical protein